MPIVHGIPLSPFVRKVLVAHEEKGLGYEVNPVIPLNVSDEYRQKSPLGKVPCYEDGDYVLPDSSAILAYLDRATPEPPLIPADAKNAGRALWFEEYADTKMMEVIGTIFFQRVVGPSFMNQPTDQAVVDKAVNEDLPPILAYLEGQLADADALVGGSFSIADVAVGSALRQLVLTGEKIDSGKYPKLARYAAAIHARPSFAKCFAAEASMMPGN